MAKRLSKLSKDEKSLLLFFEAAYVDYAGKLNPQHMNNDDRLIAERWTKEGFVEFGRVQFKDCISEKTNYVFLSDEAIDLAHQERKERANRMQKERKWKTTSEKTNCPI
jgi:hypothetical protein